MRQITIAATQMACACWDRWFPGAARFMVLKGADHQTQFYGGSFIAGQLGAKAVEAGETRPEVIVQTFDLDEVAEQRKKWGIFRTRRTDLYTPIRTERAPEYLMDNSRS